MTFDKLERNDKFMLRKGGRTYLYLGYSTCFFAHYYCELADRDKPRMKLYYQRDGRKKIHYLGCL